MLRLWLDICLVSDCCVCPKYNQPIRHEVSHMAEYDTHTETL